MRIYHLDLKVAMFQESWIKDWFSRLSEQGYGGVCVEVDNKLVFPSHPEFAASDALTSDQWRGLARFGKQLGLVVYPLIQTLGHMEHVLVPDTPLRKLAEAPGNPYMFCPSKPATHAFILDLIRDANEAFDHPGRIHLGGDECRLVGMCPHCHGQSLADLLVGYMRQLYAAASTLGMQVEFWADMVLAHPETLDHLPTDIRFVDWLYNRTCVRGPDLKHCWGYPTTAGLSAAQLLEGLPSHLEPLRPFLTDGNGVCNAFYGAHYLKSKGYEVMLASGVRFAGDSYALPRTRTNLLNVGATEEAAVELGADHLVTSWAVRLSHPETTWPGMLATDTSLDEAVLARVGASIGGLDGGLLATLDQAQQGLNGIDILPEPLMRYQRPFYADWLGYVREIRTAPDAAERAGAIRQRIQAAATAQETLQARLDGGSGDRTALRHWIVGLRLLHLRTRQVLAMLEPQANLEASLRLLIEENHRLMGDFIEVWRDSLTPTSLANELEIKFRRDIRVLTEILG